jgi:hypothetical protein
MGQMGQYQTTGLISIMPQSYGVQQHPIAFCFSHFAKTHDKPHIHGVRLAIAALGVSKATTDGL